MAYGLWLVVILILFYCDLCTYGGVVGGTGLRGFVWFRLPNADDLGADGVKFAHIFFLQFADLRNSTILFVSTSVRLARSFMCMPMVSHCALLYSPDDGAL